MSPTSSNNVKAGAAAGWDTGEWTPLLAEAVLEAGQPQRVEAAGVGLVLLRDGDDVLAVGEFCPHLGAPMVDGWMDRGSSSAPGTVPASTR